MTVTIQRQLTNCSRLVQRPTLEVALLRSSAQILKLIEVPYGIIVSHTAVCIIKSWSKCPTVILPLTKFPSKYSPSTVTITPLPWRLSSCHMPMYFWPKQHSHIHRHKIHRDVTTAVYLRHATNLSSIHTFTVTKYRDVITAVHLRHATNLSSIHTFTVTKYRDVITAVYLRHATNLSSIHTFTFAK